MITDIRGENVAETFIFDDQPDALRFIGQRAVKVYADRLIVRLVTESEARELVAGLQTWLDAPRLAARANPEIIARSIGWDDGEPIGGLVLLRTTAGEWGVGEVEPHGDEAGPEGDGWRFVEVAWFTAPDPEQSARAYYAGEVAAAKRNTADTWSPSCPFPVGYVIDEVCEQVLEEFDPPLDDVLDRRLTEGIEAKRVEVDAIITEAWARIVEVCGLRVDLGGGGEAVTP